MDLKNQLLDEWLQKAPAKLYPHNKKIDHYVQYKKLKDYLETNVHNDVTLGANLKDPDILLNDHGPAHIQTVIKRASDLLQSSKCVLTPFEVYILLCSIEVHDVGNLFGRVDHEKKAIDVILNAPNICGRDNIEAKTISTIAETHGGRLNDGSKDKIDNLQDLESLTHGKIRSKLLASILRFADELADDNTRSNISLLIANKLPKKSEVFHAYAHCLQSVTVNQQEHSVELKFSVPKKFLTRQFGKMGKKVHLVNEIYERLFKMHLERKYCMSFSRGEIDIDRIRVEIEFYDDKLHNFIPRMVFFVQDKGYPDMKNDIFHMCPELIVDSVKKDGKYFKKLATNEKSI